LRIQTVGDNKTKNNMKPLKKKGVTSLIQILKPVMIDGEAERAKQEVLYNRIKALVNGEKVKLFKKDFLVGMLLRNQLLTILI